MKLSKKKIEQFQKEILEWYVVHKRSLPWRKDRDPYHILVSEVMLQQTQVSRVIPKYEVWMKRFPDIESLAIASTRDVLLHWSGLGYNRRALYLKELAVRIIRDFRAIFPKTEQELMQLPGIGEYTARAILCFAFNEQVAVVDTNIRKVILTHWKVECGRLKLDKDGKKKNMLTQKDIESIAQQLVPKNHAYEWNQALMDYAAAELKTQKIPIPRQPKFKDSDRYYRGQIVKILIEKKHIYVDELVVIFKKFSLHQDRLQTIIHSLEKDQFLQKKGNRIILVE